MTTAVFLLDGGPRIGLGHIRRSMRLMSALSAAGVTTRLFVPAEVAWPQAWGPRAEPWPADLADLPAADIVVADSYRLPEAAVRAWGRRFGIRVIVDDLADRALPAEVVLNHNINGASLDYSAWNAQRVLAGPQWALVDESFHDLRAVRSPDSSTRILVSFGGVESAAGAETAKAVFDRLPSASVDLVVPPGAAMPDISHPGLRLLPAPVMVDAMSNTGIFVGAAGVTVLEASAAGMSLCVCALYDNQAGVVAELCRLGFRAFANYDAGALAEAAVEEVRVGGCRNALSDLIDGQGAQRVARVLLGQAEPR